MNTNSHSEALWEVLHQAQALLTEGGFLETLPPLPSVPGARSAPVPGEASLVDRYGSLLVPGTPWPQGTGSHAPQAILLTDQPLSSEALAFVRTWFENSRVNLVVSRDLLVQPVPRFEDRKTYQAWIRDLCEAFQPKGLLSLGEGPAQKVLGAPLSLETLRGSDYRIDRWSMVTTADPEGFSAVPDPEKTSFKAQVWKDLQRLLGKLKYG